MGGNIHVEALVPVRIQSLFHDAGGVCLLGVNCDDGKRIRQTEESRPIWRGHLRLRLEAGKVIGEKPVKARDTCVRFIAIRFEKVDQGLHCQSVSGR